jgi:hypothetical protein
MTVLATVSRRTILVAYCFDVAETAFASPYSGLSGIIVFSCQHLASGRDVAFWDQGRNRWQSIVVIRVVVRSSWYAVVGVASQLAAIRYGWCWHWPRHDSYR